MAWAVIGGRRGPESIAAPTKAQSTTGTKPWPMARTAVRTPGTPACCLTGRAQPMRVLAYLPLAHATISSPLCGQRDLDACKAEVDHGGEGLGGGVSVAASLDDSNLGVDAFEAGVR